MRQEAQETIERRKKALAQMYSTALKNIPFSPEPKQVIYVENIYDENINCFIKENYEELTEGFKKKKMEFIYLPFFFNDAELQKKIQYYAPYLDLSKSSSLSSSYILDFMLRPENRIHIAPSLLFYPRQGTDEWVFRGIAIDDIIKDNGTASDIVENVYDVYVMLDAADAIRNGKAEFSIANSPKPNKSEEVSEPSSPYGSEDNTVPLQQSVSEKDYDDIYFRVKDDDSNIVDLCEKHEQKGHTRFCERNEPQKSETEIDNETAEEIAQIYTRLNETIKSLRLKGITLGAIHEFIDKQEPLSPIVITEDLRIFLPLYNNIEI